MLKDIFGLKTFRSVAVFAAVVLVFGLAACGGGGDGGGPGAPGTKGNPHLISTAVELAVLAVEVNGGYNKSGVYYKLANDINLYDYIVGEGWTPIGRTSFSFSGHFDGNGKTVSNLRIDRSGTNGVGLFGYIKGGTVKNLCVELHGDGITGNYSVGGVVGSIENGGISNCYVTGKVVGNSSVGGVAGSAYSSSSISNCYAAGEVSGVAGGDGGIGGVAGLINNSSVSNSYATNKVSGLKYVGGVAGDVSGAGSVSNCAALNQEIVRLVGAEPSFGRVTGSVLASMHSNSNIGFSEMKVCGATIAGGVHNDENGVDIPKGDVTFRSSYEGASYPLAWNLGLYTDDHPWKWGVAPYSLPILYWQTVSTMSAPPHLF